MNTGRSGRVARKTDRRWLLLSPRCSRRPKDLSPAVVQNEDRTFSGQKPRARARTRVSCLAGAWLLTPFLTGCFFSQRYPHDWSKLSSDQIGTCPAIAGRYADTATASTPSFWYDHRRGPRDRTPAGWNGSQSLAENLAGIRPATWIEIEQPDPDTVAVIAYPESAANNQFQGRRVMKASKGEFSCDAGGLRISGGVASVFGGRSDLPTAARAAVTTMMIFAGGAGAHTHQRLFRRAVNGDLIMEVKEGEAAIYYYVIPTVTGENLFVRWPRYEAEGEPAPPSASEASPKPDSD